MRVQMVMGHGLRLWYSEPRLGKPSPRRLSPRSAQSGDRTQPESQGSASPDMLPPRGEGVLVVSKVDPLYRFACALEWRASCREEAFSELLSALTSADAGTRLVAEALLRKCQSVPSGFKKAARSRRCERDSEARRIEGRRHNLWDRRGIEDQIVGYSL